MSWFRYISFNGLLAIIYVSSKRRSASFVYQRKRNTIFAGNKKFYLFSNAILQKCSSKNFQSILNENFAFQHHYWMNPVLVDKPSRALVWEKKREETKKIKRPTPFRYTYYSRFLNVEYELWKKQETSYECSLQECFS